MSDDDKKVVSIFSGGPIGPEHLGVAAAAEAAAATFMPKEDLVDQNSVKVLNTVIEDVLKGKVRSICVIGTNIENNLSTFYLSFAKGHHPQVEATRYLGQLHLFEGVVEEIVYEGVGGDQ